MKPFNVEIFDRNLNYKYSYLLDSSEFNYSEDAMDPVKNTIPTPSNFSPVELDPADGRAPKGWYLRVLNDEIEIQGIITVYESEETRGKLTFSQMITRLDLNMLVNVGDLTQYTIENYIKKLITDEFINSTDAKQVIPGLSNVEVTTSTTGTFEYTDTDEERVSIDFLDDLVYPAFELYSIITDVTFNPQTKTINISIGQKNAQAITIEADLPNISDASFTIQKYSKEINKVDCYDIAQDPPARTNFYLHPDGTWNTDAQNNRIVPIVNSIVQLDGYAAAKAVIDAQLNEQYLIFCDLNETSITLTTAEKSTLDAFAAKVCPPYVANNPIPQPSIAGSDSVSIGSTSYSTDRQYYDEYTASLYWEDDVVEHRARLRGDYVNCRVHVMIEARVTAARTYGGQQWTDSAYLQKPFTNQLAQTGLNLYKKTAAYEAEIAAVYAQAVADAMQARAKALFAKNKYSNLIELSMLVDDDLVKPLTLELGNAVSIIHKGVSYSSILSGRSWASGLATLTFGTIRLELTSFLKGRY